MEVEHRSITLFKPDTGEFDGVVTGHPDYVLTPTAEAWPGGVADAALDDSWWFNDGEAKLRQRCPAVLDGLVLRGVPPASVIVIEGNSYPCESGGDVELEFEFAGTYLVTVVCWPYLKGSYTVENPAR